MSRATSSSLGSRFFSARRRSQIFFCCSSRVRQGRGSQSWLRSSSSSAPFTRSSQYDSKRTPREGSKPWIAEISPKFAAVSRSPRSTLRSRAREADRPRPDDCAPRRSDGGGRRPTGARAGRVSARAGHEGARRGDGAPRRRPQPPPSPGGSSACPSDAVVPGRLSCPIPPPPSSRLPGHEQHTRRRDLVPLAYPFRPSDQGASGGPGAPARRHPPPDAARGCERSCVSRLKRTAPSPGTPRLAADQFFLVSGAGATSSTPAWRGRGSGATD